MVNIGYTTVDAEFCPTCGAKVFVLNRYDRACFTCKAQWQFRPDEDDNTDFDETNSRAYAEKHERQRKFPLHRGMSW